MRIARIHLPLILIAALAAAPLGAQSTFDHVDPMIGTGGEGHTFPGAAAPFGMVQLSPDTDPGQSSATAINGRRDIAIPTRPSKAFQRPISRAQGIPISAISW